MVAEAKNASGGANDDANANGSKAAALLLALGPETAADVLRLMPRASVAKLAASVKALESSPASAIDDVARDFIDAMEGYGTARSDTRGIALREIMERALGEEGMRKALSPA